MNKGNISNLLRQAGLIFLVDRLRYYVQRFKNRKINGDFKRRRPDVVLPPDYLIYESFQINYQKYFEDGADTAKWLAGHVAKHTELRIKRSSTGAAAPAG